jgi:hypothetical protein
LLSLGPIRGRQATAAIVALAFLIAALAPAWRECAAWSSDLSDVAELAAALGESTDALSASICHHDDQGLPGNPPADGNSPVKKSCPLCQAFQALGHALPHDHADLLLPVSFQTDPLAPTREAQLSSPLLAGEERSQAAPCGLLSVAASNASAPASARQAAFAHDQTDGMTAAKRAEGVLR